MDNKMKDNLIKQIDLLLVQTKSIKNVEKEILNLIKSTLTLMKKTLRTDQLTDELGENLDELSNYFLDDLGFDMEFSTTMEDVIREFEDFCDPSGNELSVVVDEICNAAFEEDTLESYIRVQSCCCDCIKLVDRKLFSKEELVTLDEITRFWKKEKYQQKKIAEIAKKAGKIRNSNEFIRKLLSSLLLSYEEATRDFNRPYVMESFIYDLQELDMNASEMLYIILKHYPEYSDL